MNTKWNEFTISAIGDVIGGGTPSTKHDEYYNDELAWLTPKDLSNFKGRYISRGERSISQKGYDNSSAQMMPAGTVLFSSRAPIGYVAIAKNELCTNQGFKSVVPHPEVCDSEFLYYLLCYRKHDIEAIASGTTFMEVSGTALKNFVVRMPDISTQKKIASVLSSLDKRIEGNNLINHNLEKQAKAIFKSWFIDAPECKAWDSVPLKELVVAMRNGDWGKDNPCGNNTEVSYCIRGADIPDVNAGNKGKMPIRYILPKNYEKKHLVEGDIVVEISGGSPTQSTGRCAVISQALLDRYEQKIVCTNFCKALKPLDGYSHFLYYYWTYLYEKGCFFAYENGTTGIKNLDIAGIIENEFLQLPPIEIMEKFNELCDKLASTIFSNGTETERLAQLRDALLPKLMSGEINVSEVEI